ncbi:hypothetical protein [Methylophilus sp. 3sh_L]|uniref:hypothetical protein n=1 Tax=Methylophilus sp. 3sh_L TaxID=3377114 RepID=UPI00398EB321
MNRKQRIRSRFESELVSSIKKFFNRDDIDEFSQQAIISVRETSMPKQLLTFFIKLMLVMFVFYFSINKVAHVVLDAASESLVTKKTEIHEWIATSIKDEGVIYALIDGFHDPVLANSLAKYFLRIGDDMVAIKLAKLSLKLGKQPTHAELDASNQKLLTEILGHE